MRFGAMGGRVGRFRDEKTQFKFSSTFFFFFFPLSHVNSQVIPHVKFLLEDVSGSVHLARGPL